ncbi:hypothetical protein B0H66DRAFT_599992 [Apodospora peruviana]|uniref:2EXR domain-containing protein n=1 Tax=Apodospora peruviana TaxID=516989 RepID=A0AAE0IIT1_9PEZI|nr:hypothetical protein B0H66DRAFT_599992 [Apodospora peruviana]
MAAFSNVPVCMTIRGNKKRTRTEFASPARIIDCREHGPVPHGKVGQWLSSMDVDIPPPPPPSFKDASERRRIYQDTLSRKGSGEPRGSGIVALAYRYPVDEKPPKRRKVLYRGNRDEDVEVLEPPRGLLHREMLKLINSDGSTKKLPPPPPSLPQKTKQPLTTTLPNLPQRVAQTVTQNIPTPQIETRPQSRPPPIPHEVIEIADDSIVESIETPPCYFFEKLPIEIRDKIYRHLLVSPKPFYVKRLWTEPARSTARRTRTRRRAPAPEKLFQEDILTSIDTRILRVCKLARDEGTRILYSENRFHYLLRDGGVGEQPQMLADRVNSTSRGQNRSGSGGRQNARAQRPTQQTAGTNAIDFHKYCHLFRHMAIELEPNRTGKEYEMLMVRALEALAATESHRRISLSGQTEPNNNKHKIFLNTLTITITPVSPRGARPGSGDPNVAKFFSEGRPALDALLRINVRSLRVNVHVDRKKRCRKSLVSYHANTDIDDNAFVSSDDEDDDMLWPYVNFPGGITNTLANPPTKRHLETTIDLRLLPRYIRMNLDNLDDKHEYPGKFVPNIFSRRPGSRLIEVFPDHMWQEDQQMLIKRATMGQEAARALENLKERIMAACDDPDKAVRDGLWEDYERAEERRKAARVKHLMRFDCDALAGQKRKKRGRRATRVKGGDDDDGDVDMLDSDDEYSLDSDNDEESDSDDESDDSDEDEEAVVDPSQRNSLIFSISRYCKPDGEWVLRAYRA